MTDSEIVKALECCVKSDSVIDCFECPYYEVYSSRCVDYLCKDALDLINKLEAENERLSRITRTMVGEIKAEAYTEFAERLKEKTTAKYKTIDNDYLYEIDTNFINNLLKEMVGEDNA